MEKMLDKICKVIFNFWIVLVAALIIIQVDKWIEARGKGQEARGKGQEEEPEGIKNVRNYIAVQEFLKEIAPKKKGEVCYIGLEDGRVLKARLIKE